jgi:tRNA U34 5-carboxymethylaminomethyl modifying GTPase MnmE/TrmE
MMIELSSAKLQAQREITIEEELIIDGVLFRFIDTAGIRTTTDIIEQIGVNKAFEMIKKSAIVIYLFDTHELSRGDLELEMNVVKDHIGNSQLLVVGNTNRFRKFRRTEKESLPMCQIFYSSLPKNKVILNN